MLFEIDPKDTRPIYRQIMDEVQRGVAGGMLKPDEPLPAVRQLASELKLNPNTVQHAYRELEQAGLVVRAARLRHVRLAAEPGPRQAGRSWPARSPSARCATRSATACVASDLIAAIKEIAPKRD